MKHFLYYNTILQIAELTSQVASLEIQMKQGNSQSDRIGAELKQLKDLCLKLDQEKDELKRELRNQNDQRDMVSITILSGHKIFILYLEFTAYNDIII